MLQSTCGLCSHAIHRHEPTSETPCGHYFHSTCLMDHLRVGKRTVGRQVGQICCPNCQVSLAKQNERVAVANTTIRHRFRDNRVRSTSTIPPPQKTKRPCFPRSKNVIIEGLFLIVLAIFIAIFWHWPVIETIYAQNSTFTLWLWTAWPYMLKSLSWISGYFMLFIACYTIACLHDGRWPIESIVYYNGDREKSYYENIVPFVMNGFAVINLFTVIYWIVYFVWSCYDKYGIPWPQTMATWYTLSFLSGLSPFLFAMCCCNSRRRQ